MALFVQPFFLSEMRIFASGEVAPVSTASGLASVVATAAAVTMVAVVALLDLVNEFGVGRFASFLLDAMNDTTITIWFHGQPLEF